MFESDDFDQILSQFDIPEETPVSCKTHLPLKNTKFEENFSPTTSYTKENDSSKVNSVKDIETSKQIKRKIIDSHFNHKSKRKFPGPAGLLAGTLKENNDDDDCKLELLSQDVDFTQNCLHKDAFDSPLWHRLLEDVKDWKLGSLDTMKVIKQCTLGGPLRRRKAQTVAAFIESVDRSIIDPLITLRDTTGSIKCTLHRDAWSKFSHYLVSETCAIILWKPTILTTGSTYKKHYLNITLSNIFAIYSSLVMNDESNVELPDGYAKIYEEDFTVVSTDVSTINSGLICSEEPRPDTNDLLEGLDSFFSDDIF